MAQARGVAPGFLLMPAREYTWSLKNRIQIELPLTGKISDFLEDASLPEGAEIAGEDDFSIMEDGVLLLWEVLRVLFAQAQYPALESDECLNVVAMEFKDGKVVLHGEVIKSIS